MKSSNIHLKIKNENNNILNLLQLSPHLDQLPFLVFFSVLYSFIMLDMSYTNFAHSMRAHIIDISFDHVSAQHC